MPVAAIHPDARADVRPVAQAVAQVTCAVCGAIALATVGTDALCTRCGARLPAPSRGAETPYPLTGEMRSPLVPPKNPYDRGGKGDG